MARLAEVEAQLMELRPQIVPAADIEQPTNRTARDADFLRTVSGGSERISQYGAEALIVSHSGNALPSMPQSMLRTFPADVQAAGHYVWVTGSVPTTTTEGPDAVDVVAEYGRLALYPLIMSHNVGFFNGQIGVVTTAAIKSAYAGMRCAASSIVSIYGYPFVPYYEAAVVMYHIGCATSPKMFVVEPMKLDVAYFPDRQDTVCNIAGAPYESHTLRHRVGEVYRILETGMQWYQRVHGADRRVSNYFLSATRPSVASLLANKRHVFITHSTPALTGATERDALGGEMFRHTSTDIAMFLSAIYQLALCKNRTRDAHGDKHVQTVIGHARGLLSGFIAYHFTYKQTNVNEFAHQQQMVPVALFLNAMLAEFDAAIREEAMLTPYHQ